MKTLITSQGATGTRSLSQAIVHINQKNAVVHGHFSLASLYSNYSWNNSTIDKSILFGTEMKHFYDELSINDCFEHLKNVFDDEKKHFFFVHTFTIDSLINRNYDFNNNDILLVNLMRNPIDVLNSSLSLAKNGYTHSIFNRNLIISSYPRIIEKLNNKALAYLDSLSKSIGAENAMITLFTVDGVKKMLDEMLVGKKLNIPSYYIEDLSNKSDVATKFLKKFICPKEEVYESTVFEFQKNLNRKENTHSLIKKHGLNDVAFKLLSMVLDCNIDEYTNSIIQDTSKLQHTHIKNISIDFFRDIQSENIKLKNDILDSLLQIIHCSIDPATSPINCYTDATELICEMEVNNNKINIIIYDNFIWFCPQGIGAIDFSLEAELLYEKYKQKGVMRCSLDKIANYSVNSKEKIQALIDKILHDSSSNLFS